VITIPSQFAAFPALNAALNATSGVLITVGRWFIAHHRKNAHRSCMIAAVVCSSLFLISYVYFHVNVGTIRFQGHGPVRPVYFTILITRTFLAIVLVPLVIVTLTRALRQRFDRHRALARWTFPVWLYVSVTGVIIYFMLYQWFAV